MKQKPCDYRIVILIAACCAALFGSCIGVGATLATKNPFAGIVTGGSAALLAMGLVTLLIFATGGNSSQHGDGD